MGKMTLEKGREKQPRRSTERPSVWQLGGLSAKQLGKRIWTQMDEAHDDTFGRAAELAFWFFLAVFPGLIFLLTIFGLVAGSNPGMRNELFQYLTKAMPGSAAQLVHTTIAQTTKSSGGWKMIAGILGALWSASSGVASAMTVLNQVYNVKDSRSYFRLRFVLSIWLTIALSALMIAALGMISFGGIFAGWLGGAGSTIWSIVQWPVAIAFVMFAFALLYYNGPDLKEKKWYWITPGSAVGVFLWIVVSVGFRVYLDFFNTYSSTYGSLGAVIILMMWFYVSSLAFLIGAEINAEIEHAAAEHGRADAKLKGEKEAPAA